jgi:DNA-directed RNA polymerase subunit RPC12/RpoP
MTVKDRVKVHIRCNLCGERFILKGRKEKGKIDTGFKQCLCSNVKDFLIETKYF